MTTYSHRAAAVVLAACLTVSTSVGATPHDRSPRERDVPKILKLIKKLVGIGTLDDLPLPPPPKP
jgi:hypothetical protein